MLVVCDIANYEVHIAFTGYRTRVEKFTNADLANGIGNAVNRVTALVDRHLPDGVPVDAVPLPAADDLPRRVDAALARFDRRAAVDHITGAVAAINEHIVTTEPWRLAKAPDAHHELTDLLATYHATLTRIVDAARPIVPALAARADRHLCGDAFRSVIQRRLETSVDGLS